MNSIKRSPRKAIISVIVILLALLLARGSTRTLAGPTFTGDVPTDFTTADTVIVPDPNGIDVGVPVNQAPPGTISGWDMSAVYFDYDWDTDIMYIGIDCYGICGDADGDGDPGSASGWLTGIGGIDYPDLDATEGFAVLFDTNNTCTGNAVVGDYEAVVGVDINGDITARFGVYDFNGGSPYAPTINFGNPLTQTASLFASPSAAQPDIELSVADFSTLPGFTFIPGESYTMTIQTFMGSLEDAGIGEDNIPFQAQCVSVTIPAPPDGISLQKTVYTGWNSGASCPGTDLVVAPNGTNITYCFTVTNTGETYLDSITLNDPDLGITQANMTLISGSTPLAPGASLVYIYETTVSGNLINTATVNGNPTNASGTDLPGHPDQTDSDGAEVQLPAEIGDFVWDDQNNDGLQTGGEPGIPNVTVNLYDGGGTLKSTTTTNASGFYNFTNLIPGDYFLEFIPPAGYTFSPQDQGGDDTLDSDADTTTGRTPVTTLSPGETDLTWDAGMFLYATIGNFVWEDFNTDGIQDPSENPVPNVTVNLYDGGGNLQSTTTTNASGLYSFTLLIPGDYFVEFVLPAGYTFSPQDQGGDDTLDSDADTTTGQTIVTTLSPGETDLTWDAGLIPLAALGDLVWEDLDADGVQDPGEPGIPNVTVNLYDNTSTLTDTTTTDANGLYTFTSLTPGDYFVEFVLPAGYIFSPQDVGGDDTLDSDADTTTGRTIFTTLGIGETDLTWDAGMYRLAAIGDFVWQDTDANGQQDTGEPGIPNVTVRLYDGGGTNILTTTTNASGLYTFTNLIPGDYFVEFILPAGWNFSPQDQGGDDSLDSDADTTTGQTIVTTLISGETDNTWDAGLYQFAALGDFVWDDTNADGVQNPGEPGLPNVTVNLYDSGGAPQGTTTTDASGLYTFTNLIPGDYFVEFVPPAGYAFSPQDVGGDDSLDSDADITTGQTIVTTLDSGETDLTWDAGMFLYATIGDLVWDDLNADGVQNPGEPGIPGVTVRLYDTNGPSVFTTTTNASGFYSFTLLPSGDYSLIFTLPSGYIFSPQDQGANDAADSDADTTTGQTIVTTLSAGETDLTWDAGMYRLAAIGDFVWQDTNANGVQDTGEPGIPNVTVRLYDGGGTNILTTTTNASGLYNFTNLTPGDYFVEFILPAGWNFSPQDQGGDDSLDSDADTTTGQTIVTTLISGETDNTWDAGLYQFAALGDFVWDDTNADGVQNPGEPGLPNVTVNLYDSGGAPQGTTTTDASGLYTFTNLIPGDYFVEFVPPAGYTFSPQDQGGDDSLDSDADTTTGQTIVTTLDSGETDLTWDAGMFLYATIGDLVWDDLNADGVQNPGEPGIPGVTVRLYDTNGPSVFTTTTNASGLYSFTVSVGSYFVEFVPPAGYTFSPQDQGGDDTLDSDADTTTGQTAATTLTSGEIDLTWDAGLYRLGEIGDLVWNDDGDGIQEPGEPGLPGVTVRLYDGGGTNILTTLTDASGLYTFTNLLPGDYIVEFIPLPGYIFSPPDQGPVDSLDSDADTATGRTTTITLTSGQSDLTWDAGMFRPATIGDLVWDDQNLDGIQNPGEPGLPGVTVRLYDGGGTNILTTTTDAAGDYTFTNIPAGDYTIEFVPPPGYTFSPQDVGGNDSQDSDPNPATGRTATTTLLPGETDNAWDAGMYATADLSVTKTESADPIAPGAPLTYTIVVRNDGPATAPNVVLTDTLPAAVTFVSANPAQNTGPNPLVWNLGDFGPGDVQTITLQVIVNASANADFTNRAEVSSDAPDNDPTDNTHDQGTQLLLPQVQLDKRLVGIDPQGASPRLVTFTIQITNTGASVITQLPLNDVYDTSVLSFRSASLPPDEPADDGNLAWYDLTAAASSGFGTNLAPGQSFLITVVFEIINDFTSTTNTAIVSGAQDEFANPLQEENDAAVISNVPTAVELLYFTVEGASGRSVTLAWATAMEINNLGFYIYRAAVDDFSQAQAVGFVPSAVFSAGQGADYTFTDSLPGDGQWYYWLVDVDTGGAQVLSTPASVNITVYALFIPSFKGAP